MSRIVVVGGHGRTGKLIVDKLVANGDTVVATIRNPKHMADLVKAGAETVILDLEKSTGPEFAFVFAGADAVVFAAGSAEGESSAIDRTGTLKVVRATKKAGVPRFVTVSSIGATTPVPKEWSASAEMKEYFAAKKAANKTVRESGLNWTIIEPGELTEGKPTGKIALGEGGIDIGKIARADVAATVVAALKTPKSAGHTFQIVGGKTAIADAVEKASASAPKAMETPAPEPKPGAVAKAPAKAPAKPASKASAKAGAKPPAKKVPAKGTAKAKK